MIRRARESDAAAIATIYNQAMAAGTFATCDVAPVTPESRIGWLAGHRDPVPGLRVRGRRRPRAGLGVAQSILRSRELPVESPRSRSTCDEAHRSRTVGAALFVQLITEAKSFGFRSLVSLTFERNRPSLRGLEAAGFRTVGVLSEVAWLRGRWESVVWLEKDLAGDWTLGLDPRLRARLART